MKQTKRMTVVGATSCDVRDGLSKRGKRFRMEAFSASQSLRVFYHSEQLFEVPFLRTTVQQWLVLRIFCTLHCSNRRKSKVAPPWYYSLLDSLSGRGKYDGEKNPRHCSKKRSAPHLPRRTFILTIAPSPKVYGSKTTFSSFFAKSIIIPSSPVRATKAAEIRTSGSFASIAHLPPKS